MLNINNFDFILIIYWLSKYKANIDFFNKTITFKFFKDHVLVILWYYVKSRLNVISDKYARRFLLSHKQTVSIEVEDLLSAFEE